MYRILDRGTTYIRQFVEYIVRGGNIPITFTSVVLAKGTVALTIGILCFFFRFDKKDAGFV